VYACAADEDCAEVPADCCGCERGGANAAVAATAVGDYLDLLDCPAAPDCPPDVNVCDSTLVPRCIGQVCTLGPPPGVGVFCGVPDYPACPKGQACVLNHPDAVDATRLGLGTCHDA